MLNKNTFLALGALSLLAAASAHARDGFFEDSRFRIGVAGAHVKIVEDDLGLSASSSGWEIFGGFELNRYLAIEAGYLDGGAADDEFAGMVVEAKTTALYASVIASLPLSEHASLYARGGLLGWEADQQIRMDGVVIANGKADGTDPFVGLGVSAVIDEALLRLEYRYAEIDDADLSLLSLGIAWRF